MRLLQIIGRTEMSTSWSVWVSTLLQYLPFTALMASMTGAIFKKVLYKALQILSERAAHFFTSFAFYEMVRATIRG